MIQLRIAVGKANLVLLSSLVGILFQSGCSLSPSRVPTPVDPSSGTAYEELHILGTNDIHGAMAPMMLKTREPEGVPTVEYEAGGLAYLSTHIRLQRNMYGDRFLWLDAGDEFQGSLDSNIEKGRPMVQYFNLMGLQAAAIGNHEFDYGPDDAPGANPKDLVGALKSRMGEALYPYLSANIFEKATQKRPQFPNLYASILKQVGSVKVGIIGLTTEQTPTTTRPENVAHLDFRKLSQATLTEAKALRAQGAEVILVVAHAGVFCTPFGKPTPGSALWSPEDAQPICDSKQEIPKLLQELPEGTVDAIVSGHTHSVVHHWIRGVPVIQGGSLGRYYNVLHLYLDKKNHKVQPALTRIEGPIPVCPKVFENQGNCDGERPAPAKGRGRLIKARLHGTAITADAATESQLDKTFQKTAPIRQKIIGFADQPIDFVRGEESALGNLFTDAIREAAHADFAFLNPGGLRAQIEKGPIAYENVFRSMPFDNQIAVLRVSGRELRQLIQVVENGAKGYFPVSGLKLRLIGLQYEAPTKDLNGDRKIDFWEINRLIEMKQENGDSIEDQKMYTVATSDFLVSGGDSLEWVMSQIPPTRKSLLPGTNIREAAVTYLSQHQPVNSRTVPLVRPDSPRVKFERAPVKSSKKSGRKSGRSGKNRHSKHR